MISSMYNFKVSILLPTLNSEKYLDRCLNSIVKQVYKNIEIIVIDGFSKDKTLKILNQYSKKLNIKVLQKNTKNLAAALNYGLSNCKGDFIARLDSDDLIRKKRLLKQVKFLSNNLNYDVVGTNALRFTDRYKFKPFLIYYSDFDLKLSIFFQSPFIHPSIMLRRSFIEKEKIKYNEEFNECEDFMLWYSLSKKTKFKNLKYFGIFYRVHSNSASNKNIENLNLYYNKVINFAFNEKKIYLTDYEKLIHTKISKLEINSNDNFIVLNNNIIKILNLLTNKLSKENIDKNKLNFFFTNKYFRFCLRCVNSKNFHPTICINNIYKINLFQYFLLKVLFIFKYKI